MWNASSLRKVKFYRCLGQVNWRQSFHEPPSDQFHVCANPKNMEYECGYPEVGKDVAQGIPGELVELGFCAEPYMKFHGLNLFGANGRDNGWNPSKRGGNHERLGEQMECSRLWSHEGRKLKKDNLVNSDRLQAHVAREFK